jgi:hypothetical protein
VNDFTEHVRPNLEVLPDLVVYHDNCTDGFCAAWIASHFVPGVALAAASYTPESQETVVKVVKDKRVLFVDWCPDEEYLDQVVERAAGVVVLDHHVSRKPLQSDDRPWLVVDDDRSGAGLCWDYFTGLVIDDPFNPLEDPPQARCNKCRAAFDLEPGSECPKAEDPYVLCEGNLEPWAPAPMQIFNAAKRPWPVEYVQDRDLWRFQMDQSQIINASLWCMPKQFPVWDQLFDLDREELLRRGAAIIFYQKMLVDEAVGSASYVELLGYPGVALASCSPPLASEVGSALCKDDDVPFAVMYSTDSRGRLKLSVRTKASRNPLRCPVCGGRPLPGQYLETTDTPVPGGECRVEDCDGALMLWPPSAAWVAEHWGGGGHHGAAGAVIEGSFLDDVLAFLR